MYRFQKHFRVLFVVLLLVFASSSVVKSQAKMSYLFVETVDSNQKPIAGATVYNTLAREKKDVGKMTDAKGSVILQAWNSAPDPRSLKIVKSGFYRFELFDLLRGAFLGINDYGRQKLTVELLRIPQTNADKQTLGVEQRKRDFFLAVLNGNAVKVREMLKAGIDPQISTADLRGVPNYGDIPAFLYAADSGDVETMNAFLDSGLDLRRKDLPTSNVLAYFVGYSSPLRIYRDFYPEQRAKHVGSYVDTLIAKGANPNAVNAVGDTLPVIVGRSGDVELLKKLIAAGTDVNAKNQDGTTPLMRMFDFYYNQSPPMRRAEIINLLLDSGADPNIFSGTKDYCALPLIEMVRYGQPEFTKLLLKHKADPNLTCTDGNNAISSLTWFSNKNYAEMLDLLIEAGANINLSGESGATPLMTAVESGDISIVKKLLSKGANVNAQDKFGRTALMFALQGINTRPDIEIVDLLLRSGADPNLTVNGISQETFGTALASAIWHEPLYCVYRSKEANCWFRENVSYASDDIIKLLIANKADLNLTFGGKDTPLVSAARGARLEAMKLLFENGVKIDGTEGKKALQVAREKLTYMPDKAKYQEVITFLETAGVK